MQAYPCDHLPTLARLQLQIDGLLRVRDDGFSLSAVEWILSRFRSAIHNSVKPVACWPNLLVLFDTTKVD